MTDLEPQAQIFYLDELSDECKSFVRVTRESPWKKTTKIDAKPGDRVIIKDVEYIVDPDLSRRRLKANEKPLWKEWDFPLLGHVPTPLKIGVTEPLHCHSLKNLAS